ncbi:hypothetical protein PS395_05865 [Limosilactobacillus pontis]
MRQVNESRVVKVTNTRYREHYHIQTPAGWLNDPNGLCFFKGYYHVFTSFTPIPPNGARCTGVTSVVKI